ncbi:MAG: aminoacyl-tRNA hydrolase [Gemmatimonadota bacterium]
MGNPGRRYDRTFHNAGFAAVDVLARALGVRLAAEGDLDWGVGDAFGIAILLGKPRTYMNLSGAAVAPVYRRFAGSPGDLIVVHDDLDIAAGLVRLKRGGGTGGHNGLRSLQEHLGTLEFLRVRIGIGRPPDGVDPADFVLSPVPDASRALFESGVAAAAEAVLGAARDGFDKAMTRCNATRLPPPSGVSDGGDT